MLFPARVDVSMLLAEFFENVLNNLDEDGVAESCPRLRFMRRGRRSWVYTRERQHSLGLNTGRSGNLLKLGQRQVQGRFRAKGLFTRIIYPILERAPPNSDSTP